MGVRPMPDGNGRLARVLMNAELVATGQHKIIVPNVAREDYLNGQRRASRAGDFRTATKVLYQLHHYTAALPATLYDELLERLERRDGAFSTPDEGVATFNAVRRAHRYDAALGGRGVSRPGFPGSSGRSAAAWVSRHQDHSHPV